jgi:ubiquinone/menaquinone biosynthesis C-methylase UbiE
MPFSFLPPIINKHLTYERLLFGLGASRSLLYFIESLPLPLIRAALDPEFRKRPLPSQAFRERTLVAVNDLLRRDSNNIAQGLYPPAVLLSEDPWTHFRRYAHVLRDAFRVAQRRAERHNADFSTEARVLLDDLPEYYRRNFHFQTDGYLSAESAEIYDHQVELLFIGCADAMRRLLIRPMKEFWGTEHQGDGLRFLELGCGRGSATRFYAAAFPRAQIVGIDLSLPYLDRAQHELIDPSRIHFIQGSAENLDFENQSFDGVFSVFLFHELPREVRQQVWRETARVLKPGGFAGFVDSLQRDDDPLMNQALEEFPRGFHEPFYKNYVETPMAGIISNAGFAEPRSSIGFLSKAMWAQKK